MQHMQRHNAGVFNWRRKMCKWHFAFCDICYAMWQSISLV